jgi:signal transduction histidine kinase/HPt (histidine-containing phosphotransfer) domain-containing protein
MTHWRTSLLISVPILLGVAVCSWTGVLQSVTGSIFASAVLIAFVGIACVWLSRPWTRLPDLARRLALGAESDRSGSDRQQFLEAPRDHINADKARIAELETQLAAARTAAARADDAKRAFLQSVGHELRTPLNAVIGMTHLSMQTSLNPQQRDYLERADRSAQSLLRQIDGILDYVRLEAGNLETAHLAFDWEDVVERVVDTAMHAAGDKPLTVRLERDATIPIELVGDAKRLGQVLITLADTIVKTANAGEIIIGARLLGIDAERAQVRFEVGCNGRDLNRPRQSPQCNADSTDKATVGSATGLDLGIGVSQRLVAALGGRLQVERRAPGGGISFSFTLPLALASGKQPCDVTDRQPGTDAPADDANRASPAEHASRHPQMNLDGIRPRLNGDSHLLRRLLLRFRTEHANFVADYTSLFQAEDRFGASQLARALASAAASLGAVELKQRATQLASKRRGDDDPSSELGHVRELLGQLLAEIDDKLAGPDSPTMWRRSSRNASTSVDDQTAQALQHLSELLSNFDAAAINRFEDLRPSLQGRVSQARIEDLQRAIHGFDLTLAQHRLQPLAADLGVPLRETT